MTNKVKVLSALEASRGSSVSGELLAQELGISRSYVWKIIRELQAVGYPITGVKNRGYCLDNTADILSASAIFPLLSPQFRDIDIIIHDVLDSTNQEAKRLSLCGSAHGTTVIALTQTAGRGRLGRTFFSPIGSGIYMSVILRLSLDISDAILITSAAAVAVCRAIKLLCPDVSPQIKWVNDIYIDKKKLCGILTEAVTSFESGMIDSLVLGIGINFTTKFEGELADICSSLFGDKPPSIKQTELIAAVLEQIFIIQNELPSRSFISEYKQNSNVLGRDINVITPTSSYQARAVDIDQSGGLVVETADLLQTTLHSGEISIRFKP